MQAMGLVAWTRGLDPLQAPLVSSGNAAVVPTPENSSTASDGKAGIADNSASTNATVGSGACANTSRTSVGAEAFTSTSSSSSAPVPNAAAMPFDIDALAEWLVEQALVQFNHRGASVSFSGSEQASLLVVCVHATMNLQDTASIQPLNAECTQLLKLMMRAIDLSMTEIRQCQVTAVGSVQSISNHDGSRDTIDGVCTPHTQSVLLLDPQYSESTHQSGSDACLMPTSSLPLWRIPHPDCLLQYPALKRHAWESLKALKQALADHRQRA